MIVVCAFLILLFAGVVFFCLLDLVASDSFFWTAENVILKFMCQWISSVSRNQRTSSQAAVKTSQVERSYGKLERQWMLLIFNTVYVSDLLSFMWKEKTTTTVRRTTLFSFLFFKNIKEIDCFFFDKPVFFFGI